MFLKIICDITHHKLYGSGLTGVIEVHNLIVYILADIIIFLYCV